MGVLEKSAGLKTYSHLMGAGRLPSEYEVATTKLHYYTRSGFEVDVPLKPWYEKYQAGSPFACRDWEAFSDPAAMTYDAYVNRRKKQAHFVETLLERADDGDYDRRLSPEWLDRLDEILTPLRFVFHGFQMVAAYIGQMAPSGRITAAALFQTGDEMRRVCDIAVRMAQIRRVRARFGDDSRARWENDARWQPLRKTLEELLSTYDWGEAFVAHNLVLKPAVDETFLSLWGEVAAKRGDYILKEILASFYEDAAWQRSWSRELLKTALADSPATLEPVRNWIGKWSAPARVSLESLAFCLEGGDISWALERFTDTAAIHEPGGKA